MDRPIDQTVLHFQPSNLPEASGTFQPERRQGGACRSRETENLLCIAIASTFTADPLCVPLNFWMQTLGIGATVSLAPYAQVMQELLNPQSLLSANRDGFSILLVRIEDWIRDRLGDRSVGQNIEHMRTVANDFIAAVQSLRSRTSASILLYFCPPSADLPAAYGSLERIQSRLLTQLKSLPGVHCWSDGDLQRLYPVAEYQDSRADRLGHIPYTSEYFNAIGTLIARRIAAAVKPRFKVIAIDCDNTLWRGVCGEAGADGIVLTEAHLSFQRMLVRQHDAGMLLCLCSKNNAADVEAVFESRPDMILQEEHVVSSRVNWNAKSSNIKSLAQELDLSLDSFLFVDDDAVECAEVRAHCPSVLTLQFPKAEDEAAHFLDHVWAFDRIASTKEATQRTTQYREDRARKVALQQTTDLMQFLASLELQVSVSLLQIGELARVAELVQRTNQFNFTGTRRSSNEIEALWKSGVIHILVAHVRDRFGDYGLVGALLFRREGQSIDVDTFVLSCRALGRGVEHRIINALGEIARMDGRNEIVLRYRSTSRNIPARQFLERSFSKFQAPLSANGETGAELIFKIPVMYAERVTVESTAMEVSNPEIKPSESSSRVDPSASTQWHEAAYRLSRLQDIGREINLYSVGRRRAAVEYVAPRTPTEAALAAIWSDVLRLQNVSIYDDFFDAGGDSVQAVRAIAKVGSVLGLDLSLQEFFECSKLEQVAARLSTASESNARIQRADRTFPLPLSLQQQRLWFIDRLEDGSTAYHIPLGFRMRGVLDREALQAALDSVLARHEALRTTFIEVDGKPEQSIVPEASFSLQFLDVRTHEVGQREVEVLKFEEEEAAAPFNLSTGPLIRGGLLQLSDEEYVLLITMHHIISDGWSVGVFIRDLSALYTAHRERGPDPLAPLPIQYADYTHWCHQRLTERGLDEHLAYWKAHLQGAPELLELPTDRTRPAVQSYRGEAIRLSLGSELTTNLKAFSRRLNLTLAMTLYTAWSIVLAKLSGQDDVVLGMPVANRGRTELEGLIGFFVNTLALRIQLEDDYRVTDLLCQVKESMLRAYTHQDVPFEQVVEALQPTRSLSHSPLFQVMLVVQNAPRGAMELPGLTLVEETMPLHTAQFDLLLSLHEAGDEICGHLNYASDLFDGTTIERWIGYLKAVLSQMVGDPCIKISALQLMSEGERHHLIKGFNATQAHSPQEKLIHELFEEQVRRTPQATALVYEGRSLSYREINARANQLARHLRERGVGPDRLVGICAERSLEMVVGLLGTLKAGGAYVPLDPAYPVERLAHVLSDSAPVLVLVQQRLIGSLPPTAAALIALDRDWSEIERQSAEDLQRCFAHNPHNLAYVIYTSGSTGKPKGVTVAHCNVTRLFEATRQWFEFNEQDVWTLFHSFAFDFSVWELWGALLYGGRLVVVPYLTARSAQEFYRLVCEEGVTVLNQTPSAFAQLIDAQAHSAGHRHALRVVIFGGEALELRMLRPWVERNGADKPQLVNMYGITETTVHVTYRPLSKEDIESEGSSLIGGTIPDLRAYLLDRHTQPVPIGVVGELYIGGAGVARGYLNRPQLTAERFIADPFGADGDGAGCGVGRLYRTGDLARWRADGTLEYLGRNDNQVKIRGFRIELGEIEAQLWQHPQVKEAVVLAREDEPGEKRLVGYVVARSGQAAPSVEGLRSHLKGVLPEYMVPSALVLLANLPLTTNGKLDRAALPAPEQGDYVRRQYEAPQGEIEEILAGVWQSLLHVKQIGRNDNFFELGGHSLLIVQMLESLRHTGLSASLHLVFESPTLASLAQALTRKVAEEIVVPPNGIPIGCQQITPQMLPLVQLEPYHIDCIVRSVPGGAANIQDIYPLTSLQEGLLFHHLLNERSYDVYVVPTLLSVSSRERLQELIVALQALVDRHDVFRTAVLWEQLPRPVQVVYRRAILRVDEVVLDPDRDPGEQAGEWIKAEQQILDLRYAPLLQLQVAADTRGPRFYVLLRQHHIIGDNQSLEIAISEVTAQLEGRAQQLPPPIPYRNHVAQVLASARTSDSEVFFRKKLGDVDEPTTPFGFLNVHGDGIHMAEAHEEFEVDLAHRVRAQARRWSVSVATLFHATWALVVARTSGRNDVVFGTVLLGQLQGKSDFQRMLGIFINTLPIRLRLQNKTAKELVIETQRELIELLRHGQASLAVAQRCTSIVGGASPFSALLNYRHNTPDRDTKWSNATGIEVLALPERTNYPIALSIDDLGTRFSLSALTDLRINPSRVTGYMHTAMRSLVEALEEAPHTLAQTLQILPDSERRQVIELFNATRVPYPKEKLIHELFEEQVLRMPDAVAVVDEGQILTYGQLNVKANRLAHCLRTSGMRTGEYIPILIPRSAHVLIAQLAVLKSGGVYVPIDCQLPIERKAFIIRDCGARMVLAARDEFSGLERADLQSIDCEEGVAATAHWSDENPQLQSGTEPAAYVMYTSGSVGTPKGVIVTHRAVNRLIINNGYAKIEPTDCVAFCSNPAFDASTFETWGALLNGATVVVVSHPVVMEAKRFAEVLTEQHVTVLWLTVGLFSQYKDALATVFGQLRYLITGGDVVDPSMIKCTLKKNPPLHFLNGYGPTEGTTFSTTYSVESVDDGAKSLPIGRPISNTQIYILDSHLQPVPIGVSGEIYIGGAGVALGYLNRPELTAERFIIDPFSVDPGARLYKSGDLGRWRVDGIIEFLGRNDAQVKIRGFRIELGEIETRLAQLDGVKEAVVLAREDMVGEKRLVAYLIARQGSARQAKVSVEALRTQLKAVLPEYMVPSAFMMLESIPLTPNGKVDRRALPAPDLGAYVSREYEAPHGEIELTLAKIWQDLLGVDRVGRFDNFFELGGHSLLAVNSLAKIDKVLHARLRVADIYKNPTLAELAVRVDGCVIADEPVDIRREATLNSTVMALPGLLRAPARAVMLTGGTGFVGRFLLKQLLEDTDAKVYCVVRDQLGVQASERLRHALLCWDLWRNEYESRVVAISGDLRLPRLGVEEATYEMLCQEIDTIYHCGTSMNHLETYAMAKRANVDSARELLNLATSRRPKLVNYLSTLGVFSSSTTNATRVVDEQTPIDNEKHLNSEGYTASKWVGEKIFMIAQDRGIPCNIFRLGLVWADSKEGRFDELQQVYRVIKSSLLSGFGIQGYQCVMPPTPVDYVVRAVVFLASQQCNGGGIFHISSSSQIGVGIFERYNEFADAALELLPVYQWVCELKRLHHEGRSLPAVPLMEFAFSMTEKAFYENQLRSQLSAIHFDSIRTHHELERAGIIAPSFNNELLRVCMEGMFARDPELRDLRDRRILELPHRSYGGYRGA
jgi:amino acid adenylation domain-containing protein/FkbH-like protein/thioester reductase-like protein